MDQGHPLLIRINVLGSSMSNSIACTAWIPSSTVENNAPKDHLGLREDLELRPMARVGERNVARWENIIIKD